MSELVRLHCLSLLLLFFYKLDISPASWRRDYLYLKDCIDHREDDAEKFLKVPGSNKDRRERTAPPLASQGRIQ